ncbi:diaminopimelate epimerase [Campylobacter mucosalis]|uniref:diaminopimelate epimerase n=1 Tax=Campylobacter mucosalis TaxID=202 RepID=UPI001470120D|nr:diaminopimelate epimerase [Campylobacter mucosalis]
MIVSKYNASGNDFVIFHTFLSKNRSELAKILCHRQNGVGADGLIVLKPGGKNEIVWEFYNSDGSHADMCGNGSRAAAKYAVDNGLCGDDLTLITGSGKVLAKISADSVEVELTTPVILNDKFVDFDKTWHFYNTGVPHLVHFTDDLSEFDVNLARELRQKYNANVNFAKISNNELFVRTYERGVENETLACGTGMAACFYGGVLNDRLDKTANVYPKSGEKLGLRLENGKIFFSGAVKYCFSTEFKG